MLNQIISNKTIQWLQSPDCAIIELINYIKNKGELRDTQIEAIETFLFLKIQGQNKPLWELFSEGFFSNNLQIKFVFMKDFWKAINLPFRFMIFQFKKLMANLYFQTLKMK